MNPLYNKYMDLRVSPTLTFIASCEALGVYTKKPAPPKIDSPYKKGDKVHLKTMNGVYTIIRSGWETSLVTTNKLLAMNHPPLTILTKDIICKYTRN